MSTQIRANAKDLCVKNNTKNAVGFVLDRGRVRASDVLVDLLVELGVKTAFGVVGGGIAPMADALAQREIDVVHTRHESGAAFAAIEASLAGGRPTVVFATTGPGITNALTGLFVARREGAQVIFVSGTTPAAQRDRWVLQESGPHALFSELYTSGSLFHYACVVEHEDQLSVVASRLSRGLRRANGFVAHIAMPTSFQSAEVGRLPRMPRREDRRPERLVDTRDVLGCAERLGQGPCMLWVGYGARECSSLVVQLAERLLAPVMSTPRGKGIFPETHPLYVGTTGLGGHRGPARAVAELRPQHTLVLGTRLGELSSGWSEALLPTRSLVHVDIDPDVPGLAYPDMPTLGIQAELGTFLGALLEALPAAPSADPCAAPCADPCAAPSVVRSAIRSRPGIPVHPCELPPRPPPRQRGPVRPQVLMDAIQRVVVEQSEALILAEAGNSFAWTNHCLRLPRPGRYRVNMGWGSMGHGATGVIGAALHHADKVVAVVGDGAMLMNCEVSTAVRYGLPVVWIVVNDSQYGMVEHGMDRAGYVPVQTAIPRTRFVELARSMGADGILVQDEARLDHALHQAMAADGPIVVDVIIDPDQEAPVSSRVDNLRVQGVECR